MKKVLLLLAILLSISLNAQQKPYVVLVSLDGFRWDYVNRGITPNLQKMIDGGVHALSLRAAFPTKTFPNHVTLVTGMYPQNHGIIGNSFPDPYSGRYYVMGKEESRDPYWYQGELFWETAARSGIKSASYFWVASELTDSARRPTYYKKYQHDEPYTERVDTVVKWLTMEENERPRFITLYMHETDSYGHEFGPNSPQLDSAVARVDSVIGYMYEQLEEAGMKDSVNVIIVSDHGMTEISLERSVNIEGMLPGYECDYQGTGPYMMIYPGNPEQTEEIYGILKENENNYTAYLKDEMPAYFNYDSHPFIAPIILVADLGWTLLTNEVNEWYENNKGTHGYEKDYLDMHGVFVAHGPMFRKGFKTGTVWNIDIYPLLCEMYGIAPRSNIDGKLERIGFILK